MESAGRDGAGEERGAVLYGMVKRRHCLNRHPVFSLKHCEINWIHHETISRFFDSVPVLRFLTRRTNYTYSIQKTQKLVWYGTNISAFFKHSFMLTNHVSFENHSLKKYCYHVISFCSNCNIYFQWDRKSNRCWKELVATYNQAGKKLH